MRMFRSKARGFTLVELMIVVAIIGVLASLAIFGVSKYLATAKSAEAKNTIGAITRGSVAAFERESTPTEILGDGATSAAVVHAFCGTSSKVPGTVPPAKKYQPSTIEGADFNTGDSTTGWKCLQFQMTEAVYYSYIYQKGAGSYAGSKAGTNGFEVSAQGDLNGNGVLSTFARGADLRNGVPVVSTTMYIDNEAE